MDEGFPFFTVHMAMAIAMAMAVVMAPRGKPNPRVQRRPWQSLATSAIDLALTFPGADASGRKMKVAAIDDAISVWDPTLGLTADDGVPRALVTSIGRLATGLLLMAKQLFARLPWVFRSLVCHYCWQAASISWPFSERVAATWEGTDGGRNLSTSCCREPLVRDQPRGSWMHLWLW